MEEFLTNLRQHRTAERGNALVEFALLVPLLTLMFVGLLQLGYYSYALISVENAARSAAMRNSFGKDTATDQASACEVATEELAGILHWSGAPANSNCSTAPLRVTSILCSSSVACLGTQTSIGGEAAVAVTVDFTMPTWLPMRPADRIIRTSQMRVRASQ